MGRKYPWEVWFARKEVFRLKRHVDFDAAPHSMSVQIRQAAANRGKRVSVLIENDVLLVRVIREGN